MPVHVAQLFSSISLQHIVTCILLIPTNQKGNNSPLHLRVALMFFNFLTLLCFSFACSNARSINNTFADFLFYICFFPLFQLLFCKKLIYYNRCSLEKVMTLLIRKRSGSQFNINKIYICYYIYYPSYMYELDSRFCN